MSAAFFINNDDVDVVALLDNIAIYLDATPVEAQVSSDSLTTQFSAEEVEGGRSTMAQILRSLRSSIDSGLINKVGKVVVVLAVKQQMPTHVADFLQLPDKLDVLQSTLLKSDKNLQVARSKSKEK